jgi:lysophospholipase L1-like esterase
LASQAANVTWNGLAAGTTYYFRLCAENSKGPSKGDIVSFSTSSPGNPPTVATLLATSVGATGATLNGNVTPNGLVTTAWFEWGTDSGLSGASSTSPQAVGSGTTSQPVNVSLTGLTTGTTYYYRVAASNSSETTKGSILSFTPLSPPPPAPTGVTATADAGEATISWSAVADATSYNIYYSHTSGVTKATGIKLSNRISPSMVTGLNSGTTYYFIVTAVNADGESVESNQVSATPFVEYVAFGSSTTEGVGDDYPLDDTSLDGRNNGGGFEPILNDLLTLATGIPHSIVNEGYGGYTTTDGLIVLPTVLANHPYATYYLIQFGSNDAGGNLPSGLGLNPGDSGYTGSYKDNMQKVISDIKMAGKIPYLAKLGYTLVAERNVNIVVYNQVIDELVVSNEIPVTPPDFYSWFQTHPDQLADNYHPNGVGYRSMANLWLNALVP